MAGFETPGILAVEDDEVLQRLLQRQLEVLGYQAQICGGAAEALRRLDAGDYVLMLTDIHMPGMTGLELASTVRRREAQRRATNPTRLTIVAMTSADVCDEEIPLAQAGIDDCLDKPVQLAVLRQTLQRWMA